MPARPKDRSIFNVAVVIQKRYHERGEITMILVTAENKTSKIVLGTGLLSDLSAGLTDFLGVESSVVGMKLGQAKEKAIAALIDNCIIAGANAAIGIDLDIMTYGPNMMVACANGTAVKIEKT